MNITEHILLLITSIFVAFSDTMMKEEEEGLSPPARSIPITISINISL